MTFIGHLEGPWGTMGDFFGSLGVSLGTMGDVFGSIGGSLKDSCTANWFCKLVLLAEHWRPLGAAAGDSGSVGGQ